MIERHHDIAANGFLRLNANFGAEQNRFPVKIALKNRAFLAHRARIAAEKKSEYPARCLVRTERFHLMKPWMPPSAVKTFWTGTQAQQIGMFSRDRTLGAAILSGSALELRPSPWPAFPPGIQSGCLHIVMLECETRLRLLARGALASAALQKCSIAERFMGRNSDKN
jgi:hypothetical protein